MGTLHVMGPSGDRLVKWDHRRAEMGDANAEAAVAEAERIFEEAQARGSTAFRIAPNEQAEKLDKFDPEAQQIIVVPQLIGG